MLALPTIGLTSLLIGHRAVLLTTALKVAEQELMGCFATCWPLTKVLDIGGPERSPNYTTECSSQLSSELVTEEYVRGYSAHLVSLFLFSDFPPNVFLLPCNVS